MSFTQTAFTGRTGARPITALARQISRELAARAESAHDVERNTLYGILEGAKAALGLGTPALETLKHLISYTRPEDWKYDRTPCAWPSNYTLAELAGVSESAIKARLRQLRGLALVTAHDSGHGRRSGRRREGGEIVQAYGIDLSPLRIRYDELRALADAQTAQSRLFKEGRQALSRSRRLIGQALAQAADLRLTGEHWVSLQEEMESIASEAAAMRAARDTEGYAEVIGRLPRLEDRMAEIIDRFMFSEKTVGSGSKLSPLILIQTNPDQNTIVHAQQAGSPIQERIRSEARLPASPSRSVFKAGPVELVRMFPTTAMYVGDACPDWADLRRAAARLRHDLGIRTATWVDALDQLGPDGASVAIMITAEREARNEIRSTAGAYFAGMVTKARNDELDLAKSLWGFRNANPAA